MTNTDLEAIDRALIGMRRLWSEPMDLQDPELGQVEMSAVWITNALSEGGSSMTVRELADALGVAHSTASRLIDRAAANGFVRRGPGSDGRAVAVGLTERGRVLTEKASRFRTGYLAMLTREWTDAERRAFADLLTRFSGQYRREPPHPK